MAQNASLNGMVYFEAVARRATITAAAEELSVSPSAVSQQIRALEHRLGVHLFRRIRQRLVLTEEGERLYIATSEALGLINDARSQVSLKRRTSSLTVRVSTSFGIQWLGPRLHTFIDANPEWELHVDATSETTDFETENIDLDIRYGSGHWPGFHVEQILTDAVLPLARPGVVPGESAGTQNNGTQNDRDDIARTLSSTRLIHTVKADIQWQGWLHRHGIEGVDTAAGLRFDRSIMALRAARDGAGIALDSATLALDDLESGALVPAFPQLGCIRFPAYWIICPARNLQRRAVRRFTDWLRAEASNDEARRNALLEAGGCALV